MLLVALNKSLLLNKEQHVASCFKQVFIIEHVGLLILRASRIDFRQVGNW